MSDTVHMRPTLCLNTVCSKQKSIKSTKISGFLDTSLLYTSLREFLDAIFAQSVAVDAVSYEARKWIKFNIQNFKRVSSQEDPLSKYHSY